jgi:outer membrane lipoprotein LolB
MSALKPISFSVVILLLSACAVVPVNDPARLHLWQLRQAELQSLSVWRLDGRSAIKSQHGSGELVLNWSQDGERFDIRLMSFLGQQQARLQGIHGGMTELLRQDQPPVRANNEQAMMQEALGWSLPLAGLRYWVLGIGQPDMEPRKALDALGRPIWLEWHGWHVDYQSYQTVDGRSLPRKLRLKHDDLVVRLVLDKWQFQPGQK